YASFNAYLEGRWEMSRRQAFNLLAATEVAQDLVQAPAPVALPSLTHAVTLARLETAQRHEFLGALERPLTDYSTRELERRRKEFQRELLARRSRRVVALTERPPQR